ncbi:hypothetical protein FCM35_KLT21368 [Carex littledalei]|uniref:Uncharacterized protein n=1 Tax=Carex littledalei TaxID=544730 RepID=A0A833R3R2_9POAL|nr:hypothetical protein FCM35_KLT21368 [Carex littledalei]
MDSNIDSNSSTSVSSSSSTPSWPDRIETLSHILTHQTLTPSLHSQFFVSLRAPCFLDWSFPPFLCDSPTALPFWTLSFFFSRASRLGFPHTTWRSLCPFQQPPPCILSSGVDPAPDRWGPQELREYARKRIRRPRHGPRVPQLLLFLVPNLALLSLLLMSDGLWRRPAS